MGKRLHPTKVLAIQSMLLETDDMYAISEALDVTYATVAYHRRKVAQVQLNGGIDLTMPVSQRPTIGLEMEAVTACSIA